MKTIAAFDYDQSAIGVYNLNREPVASQADLADWRALEIPDCDGIIAGPPCQDASRLNRGRVDRGRSKFYAETARLIAAKRPEWALIENVPAMRLQPEYRLALEILTNSGYWITTHYLTHADYGGLTTRRRLFLVAARRMLPMPTPTCQRSHWRAHGPALEMFLANRPADGWGRWNLDKARVHEYGGDATYGSNWQGEGPTYRRWDEPYFTITASENARDKSRWNGAVYALRAEERAILQGFDLQYRGLTHKQIGNAVPPEMARAWGHMLKAVYGDSQEIVSLFCGAGGFDHVVDV